MNNCTDTAAEDRLKNHADARIFPADSSNASVLGMEVKVKRNRLYNDYVKRVTPTTNIFKNIFRAFLTGGLICLISQFILNMLMAAGIKKDEASLWLLIILIAITVILTGFNIYGKIVKFGGAGALVPITGFANSVAAPAIEYKKEGQVFGIGCKIFTICGPVILYGVFTSWILGIIYYVWKLF